MTRCLIVFLMIVSFSSLGRAQETASEQIPIRDIFPETYRKSKDFENRLKEVAATLKDSPELKIYFVFYKGTNRKKSNFKSFKSEIDRVLIKCNKIEIGRVFVIDSGNEHNRYDTFIIWILDKDGKPIY